MKQVDLKPHQRKAVDELHNGCILCGGVGVGKSRVAMRYYIEKEAPRDVFVITTAKKRDSLDWVAEGVVHGIGVSEDATFHGTLTVDSWNNLWKYIDVQDAFFIFDEQRVVGSGAWVKVFLKIAKKNRWILLSATPGDTWLDYIPVFVANGLYKNRTEFLREHVVYSRYSKFPKVERYIGVGRLVRHRNQLLVEMPYERHTTRKFQPVIVEYDEALMKKAVTKRWDVFTDEPMKDVAALYRVMRRIVNSDRSRVEAVRNLMSVHPRLIVFYNFDYELEALRTLAEEPRPEMKFSNVSDGEISGHPQQDIEPMDRIEHRTSNLPQTQITTAKSSKRGIEMSIDSSRKSVPSIEQDETTSENGQENKLWNHGSVSKNSKKSSRTKIERLSKPAEQTDVMTNTPSVDTLRSRGTGGRPSKSGSETTSDTSASSVQANSSKSTKDDGKQDSGSTTANPRCSSSHSQMGSTSVQLAEWNGHKHEPIPTGDRWVYLVQYLAGAEGWNCIDTDAMVFYSLTYSYRNFEQAQGRIDRMNTPFEELTYYILKSTSWIDEHIWKALRRKENFNEKRFEKNLEKMASGMSDM